MEDFVLWLKDTRENKKISKKYLSKQIGKSDSYIHAIEKGLVKEIPEEVKHNIIAVLGYELDRTKEIKTKISEEAFIKNKCLNEVSNILIKFEKSELQGLVDLLHKRPELLKRICTIDKTKRSEIIYDNLESYLRFLNNGTG